MTFMRRWLWLVAMGVLATACTSVPKGAYFPEPAAPGTTVLSHTLYRAAQAVGDDPVRYSFALLRTSKVTALSDDDAIFYFSEGLATQPQAHIDALVAQAVAHEVLGHAGKRRQLTIGVSAGFTALGLVIPGLGLADFIVNPLIVRAFTREQELAADQRAVDILHMMGHAAPRRALATALRTAADVNGPPKGGLLAKQPDFADRLAALEPLELLRNLAARAPDPTSK